MKVAIMGYGVVGKGCAAVLKMNEEKIAASAGDALELKYILDLRDFPGDVNADKVIHDFTILENDPEISLVAEVMGGIRAAYDYTKRLLKAGKSVVTSNKELVATYGDELLALAAGNHVQYRFEASVGGGIPVLAPIEDCLTANQITGIAGIVNGTTNYILTQMKKGLDFASALKDAQQKGYAEADPTADIEGHDACRKICILAAEAFGVLIAPDAVYTEGISSITTDDILRAEKHGKVIKLLAQAYLLEDEQIHLSVMPFAVNKEHPLACVDGVFNAVMLRGNAVGDVMFYGQGAGSLPTASAVVADMIHIASHRESPSVKRLWLRDNSRYTDAMPVSALEGLGEPLHEKALY